jgi:hypothetical protein
MTTFDVTDDASLRAAIFKISNDFADDGIVNGSTGFSPPYTISIQNDITLVKSLPMVRCDGVHTITINGLGHTIDANGTGRVFFVESGKVTIANVTVDNAVAHGGNGGGSSAEFGSGGGGGLGAGAALFVNSGATVTLTVRRISPGRDLRGGRRTVLDQLSWSPP